MVGSVILSAPASFAVLSMELEFASEAALSLLFLATGFAAYLTGNLVATLEHLDDEIRPPQAPDHAEQEPPRTDMEGGARRRSTSRSARDTQSRNVQGGPSETARIRFTGWGAKRGRNT